MAILNFRDVTKPVMSPVADDLIIVIKAEAHTL